MDSISVVFKLSCTMVNHLPRQALRASQAAFMNVVFCFHRLFEMGFAEQLQEIIRRLPDARYSGYFLTSNSSLHLHLALSREVAPLPMLSVPIIFIIY